MTWKSHNPPEPGLYVACAPSIDLRYRYAHHARHWSGTRWSTAAHVSAEALPDATWPRVPDKRGRAVDLVWLEPFSREAGWIAWGGRLDRAVSAQSLVRARRRSGAECEGTRLQGWRWAGIANDITAYRVLAFAPSARFVEGVN
jgi:hypothetical protein